MGGVGENGEYLGLGHFFGGSDLSDHEVELDASAKLRLEVVDAQVEAVDHLADLGVAAARCGIKPVGEAVVAQIFDIERIAARREVDIVLVSGVVEHVVAGGYDGSAVISDGVPVFAGPVVGAYFQNEVHLIVQDQGQVES